MVIPRQVPTLDNERRLAGKGYSLVVGFDEVGRGSLAGPAMVGACALLSRHVDEWTVPTGVADSKMLTEVRRESLLEPLKAWSAAWAVGSVSSREVDEWGIVYALGVAAVRALNEIETLITTGGHTDLGVSEAPKDFSPEWHGTIAGVGGEERGLRMNHAKLRVAGILDGPNDYITPVVNSFDAPPLLEPIAMTTIVKGDRKCASVASAAVISKVIRDRMMADLAAAHPEFEAYAWASNKGYGSVPHRAAIAAHGATEYHRKTWHLA